MIFDATIIGLLNQQLADLEREFQADVVFYLGDIQGGALRLFRDLIEDLKKDAATKNRLVIILNTATAGRTFRRKAMTLRERVERTISEEREITKHPNFKRLSNFYEEMKKEGVALKQEYDLPSMDTVGRELYREVSNKSRHRR